MELVRMIGYCDKSSFIEFEIINGKFYNSIGDMVWINREGNRLQISDFADSAIIEEVTQLFIPAHRRAFKGALRRIGVNVD